MPVMHVPPTMPYFSPEDTDFILTNFKEILEGKSFLSQGKFCRQFEQDFAAYHETGHGVVVNSGSAALEAMLRAVGIEGCEVIVPANTFAASAFAVIHAGGIPVFADIGPDMTLDPANVADHLTDRTRAVLTVHIGGLVSPKTLDLLQLCRQQNLILLEDAAHAHGSGVNGRKAGTFGAAAAFSFFSTKVITTGEGGMVLTDDEEIMRRIRLLRDQAKVQIGAYQNYHEEVGFNWRMTEVQALMGLVQLKSLDALIDRRNQIAQIYSYELESLVKTGRIELLRPPKEVVHNQYKFIIFLNGADRLGIVRRMREAFGISLGGFVYEIPLHQQPVFKDYARSSLPTAEDLCARHVCLPIFYAMTDEQAIYVADALRRCLA